MALAAVLKVLSTARYGLPASTEGKGRGPGHPPCPECKVYTSTLCAMGGRARLPPSRGDVFRELRSINGAEAVSTPWGRSPGTLLIFFGFLPHGKNGLHQNDLPGSERKISRIWPPLHYVLASLPHLPGFTSAPTLAPTLAPGNIHSQLLHKSDLPLVLTCQEAVDLDGWVSHRDLSRHTICCGANIRRSGAEWIESVRIWVA